MTTTDRPLVVTWHTAATDRPCPHCGTQIRIGDPVAHLDTQPVVHVCRRCAGLEPHHAAARTPTGPERYAAIRAAAERNARLHAAAGTDPGEATLAGFGQAVADEHRRRCPDHHTGRCVDEPAGPVVDEGPLLRARLDDGRRAILGRLTPAASPDMRKRAQATVAHLRAAQDGGEDAT